MKEQSRARAPLGRCSPLSVRVRESGVRNCAMRLAGLSTSWSQELPAEWHPTGRHRSCQRHGTRRRRKGRPGSAGVRLGACGPVRRWCARHPWAWLGATNRPWPMLYINMGDSSTISGTTTAWRSMPLATMNGHTYKRTYVGNQFVY